MTVINLLFFFLWNVAFLGVDFHNIVVGFNQLAVINKTHKQENLNLNHSEAKFSVQCINTVSHYISVRM